MIFLMCKFGSSRSDRDGWEGYLGFARTSWYGTSDIQITHTKRTLRIHKFLSCFDISFTYGCQGVTLMVWTAWQVWRCGCKSSRQKRVYRYAYLANEISTEVKKKMDRKRVFIFGKWWKVAKRVFCVGIRRGVIIYR